MKITIGAVLLITLLATGCASRYVITMTNGTQITTRGKPHREDGYFVYQDVKGQPGTVSVGRVREVAPASMASPSHSSGY
jgi:hypothetical protein